jgi:HAD superfamily hydrolase (TIGR01549 family)
MNPSKYIKQFEVLLFDMSKTFMFGGDRFNKEQDYEASYKNFGGTRLTNAELHEIIYYTYGTLLERSRNEKFLDDMLSVDELVQTDEYYKGYSEQDKILIEHVFAHHECGTVSESCRETLITLSKSHKLGVISNVWCKSSYFIEQLKNNGVHDFFDIIIYSSDHKTVKPSQKIFDIAVNHFQIPRNKIVHTGDNYKRDVVGSKKAGLNSILVNNSVSSLITGEILPDLVINKIEELTY